MPTIFSHAFVAAGLGRVLQRGHRPARFWWLTALCSILPDFDAIAFRLGIAYESMWGHRGFTHSFVFAGLTGLVVAWVGWPQEQGRNWWRLAAWFALATATHPVLDMFTNGGLGVALFAPFSGERYFFPWRPVRVSPIGGGFFSWRGAATLASEFVWLWLPVLLLLVGNGLRRRQGSRSN
ncbi:metal-dependent hydrolase [Hymenobacter koreensis]|uniref:Metal-dependent hydrolase n=1 Tax=Hymenobacter koreensis TaxID=1084523 RepID=A0ABP8IZ72_9BACT